MSAHVDRLDSGEERLFDPSSHIPLSRLACLGITVQREGGSFELSQDGYETVITLDSSYVTSCM